MGRLSAVLLMLFFMAAGAGTHERDELYARFAREVEPYTVGLYLSETRFTDIFFQCTATLVKATDEYIYGFSARHCFEAEDDQGRTVRLTLYVAGHAGIGGRIKGQKAEIVFERVFNEFVVFRIRNNLGVVGDFIRVDTSEWDRGDAIYVTGYLWWDGPGGLAERVFMPTRGTILSAHSDPQILGFGDILHTASVFFGYSGGGNYVYDYGCQCFELIGVTVGLIRISLWSVAQSVIADWEKVLASASPVETETVRLCQGAEDWGERDRETLKGAIVRGERYGLEYRESWTVNAESIVFAIGPTLSVTMDVLYDRLPFRGRMNEVDWSRYECRL